ncbi:hypothetical protein V6N11_044206 [Hibiscus sabdariffa]|uniref:Uncharacterized protein n=1 Tax=Hibiscus sabdariffa TaxID=183260 RepID=A0ABR2REM9_9ROSI
MAHVEVDNVASQQGVETCADKAKRASLRDIVASLERRVDQLEESMSDVWETHEAKSSNRMSNDDGAKMEVVRKQMEDLR